MSKPLVHYISLDHLVFYRHWLEGIDSLSAVAMRYLETGRDEAAAKRTLSKIQKALVDAAKRRGKHGQARLLSIPKERLALKDQPASDVPSFEDFLADYDPNGLFGYQEVLDAYRDTHATATPESRFSERDRRLRAIRIELVNELAQIVASAPQGEDLVEGWFDDVVATRLHHVGIHSLKDLAERMNHDGYRFFAKIPKVGKVMGAKLRDFVAKHETTVGVALSAYALKPRAQMNKDDLEAVQALFGDASERPTLTYTEGTKVDPTARPEYFLGFGGIDLPDRDGDQGSNRATRRKKADDRQPQTDIEAVQAWLNMSRLNRLTHRSYMREAQRLHTWALLAKGVALSDLNANDMLDYRAHLADPKPYSLWVADKKYERFHQAWRPFVVRKEKRVDSYGVEQRVHVYGLSDSSIEQALTILKHLFNWLVQQRYLELNPLNAMPKSSEFKRVRVDRHLNQRQWDYLMQCARELPADDLATIRLQFSLHLAYSTGLRLAELAQATLGDVVNAGLPGEFADARRLNVYGKGTRNRKVPLPTGLLRSLGRYLESRGLDPDRIEDPAYAHVPLIAKLQSVEDDATLTCTETNTPLPYPFEADVPQAAPHGATIVDSAAQAINFSRKASTQIKERSPDAISASVLYKVFKTFFTQAADNVPADRTREINPETLRRASTHWLRHTHGSHALSKGASITTVKENLGHSSLETTSLYLHAEDIARQREMEAFDSEVYGFDE